MNRCKQVFQALLLTILVQAGIVPCMLAAETPESEQAGGTQAVFDVLEYVIEGNSRLSSLEVERAVYPFLGPRKTVEDVEKARGALEKAYQQSGYLTVLVDIPEQKVTDGVVTLRVVEGTLSKVRVTGNRYYSAGRILDRTTELREGGVPDFNRMQDELGSLARVQDRKIVPVLRPGQVPGTVEAELKVQDRLPLHGSLELNNRQTPNTDELRLVTTLRYDNLWQREHSASVTFITAPQATDSLRVFSGSYVVPVGYRGDALAIYTVVSDSAVNVLATTNVIGKGSITGARYIIALPQKGSLYHTLSLGVDSKDFKESQRVGSDSFETPISYVPFSAEYRATVTGPTRTHNGSIGLYTAPRGVFGNNEEEFARRRFGARPNYMYVRGDWLTEQRLASRTTLRGKVGGQLADQPLITTEQYAAGGAETVRGYLEVERLGDQGVVGSVELRQAMDSKTLAPYGQLTALAFADAATLRVLRPLPGQQSAFELYGTGVGVRLQGTRYWTAALDVAVPLADGLVTRKGEPRGHFRVEGRF